MGERALYFDTDSVVLVKDADPRHNLQTGKYLGEFKDELSEGEHIEDSVRGVPKTIATAPLAATSCVKCEGFRSILKGRRNWILTSYATTSWPKSKTLSRKPALPAWPRQPRSSDIPKPTNWPPNLDTKIIAWSSTSVCYRSVYPSWTPSPANPTGTTKWVISLIAVLSWI